MRLLLDTHIFIWCAKEDKKLSKSTRAKILAASEVYVSSASIWEITIKVMRKKIQVDLEELVGAMEERGFLELPITARHAMATSQLKDFHQDPFDRLLIAQAIVEPLTLLTADAQLSQYSPLVELV